MHEQIARHFHDTYERLAPLHGWTTRPASAVTWDLVPDENRGLMLDVVHQLLADGVIRPGPLPQHHAAPREVWGFRARDTCRVCELPVQRNGWRRRWRHVRPAGLPADLLDRARTAPGEVLHDLIVARRITPEALAVRLRVPTRLVADVLAGQAAIDANLARGLEQVVGFTAGFWTGLDALYQASLIAEPEPDAEPEAHDGINESFVPRPAAAT